MEPLLRVVLITNNLIKGDSMKDRGKEETCSRCGQVLKYRDLLKDLNGRDYFCHSCWLFLPVDLNPIQVKVKDNGQSLGRN